MSIFSRKSKVDESIEKGVKEYFELLNAYTPRFTTYEGGLYEMELTRAAIHSFATHVSKLKPEVKGDDRLQLILQNKPNALMDTKKYLYRLATGYMVDNNVFVAPMEDKRGNIEGFYPCIMEKSELINYNGVTYLRYTMKDHNKFAIELDRCGILNQMQMKDELFGESNRVMRPTMELIHTNNEGIKESVKNAAAIRFIAKLANSYKSEDITKERERFVSENLSTKNHGGVMLFDQKYEEVKQINSTPYTVDAKQMEQIRDNVFDYFGTNEKILRNNFTSTEWNAYYEGKIEPFAIEMSLVHSNMCFDLNEIKQGKQILFTANRLQYLSNNEKLQTVTQMMDRGLISLNDGREIFNMSPLPNGDKRYIRLEYTDAENYAKENDDDANTSGETV